MDLFATAAFLSSTENMWILHGVFNTLVCAVCKIPQLNVNSMDNYFRNQECG